MKKNYLIILLGGIMMCAVLISCEKEKEKKCVKCISYNDKDYGPTENCVGNVFIDTEEDLNKVAIELESEGYKPEFNEKCK